MIIRFQEMLTYVEIEVVEAFALLLRLGRDD